ncbi:rho GTPase-activating protein 45 isoform X2 [Hyla sarda]|uniref:rho GTPase-activating protein 45 isoform X2 n=1 Tax=Hyla sarda TaxID=327740 RepID=UPI0024C3E6BB|nr:rho GTPase-activating protein 45 isoform X2 [Hyla sarda]
MFSRKKRELMKTPSLSKKSRAGSPAPQSDAPRKDVIESSTDGSSNPALSSPLPCGTLKRPTSLSRHASAAGIPLSSPRTKAIKPAGAPSPPESGEGPFTEVEDISQLLGDVARFAERLEKLRDVVLTDEVKETRRPLAHECLGETLRLLRQVINKYPLLNTVETLTAAGTLISKVKGFHYEASIENEKRDFEKALESMAVCFSSTVSEFLMGEVDSSTLLSLPLGDQSQSMESLYGGLSGSDNALSSAEYVDTGSPLGDDVDVILQRSEGGIRAAFLYAKNLAKYMKDLANYIEKRSILEMEYAKGLQKLVNTSKNALTQEPFMPFQSIYSVALEQDQDHAQGVLHTALTLQQNTFLQPVNMRRLEHEKRRKELKEQWQRAQRKLLEAESNLRKAKQTYMQRSEEHEKAQHNAARAEEEQGHSGTKSIDKKRRAEEDAKNKAEEAMATYRTCIADAKTQKQELEDVKVNVLRQLQELIKQTDQILRSATISYYQSMHMETAPLPVGFQTLCESSKLYDLGQQYASYIRQLGAGAEPEISYDFQPYKPQISVSPCIRNRKSSLSSKDFPSSENKDVTGEERSVERRGGKGHQVHKSWPSALTEGDLTESKESPGFPEKLIQPISPTGEENKRLPLEQDINGLPTSLDVPISSGPFRNVGLSRAARTHRLRKLRTPSKCRECNSYVYFQGAECEECSLACHKKCLETLAIQCGHKKLQGRLLLFGRNFSEAALRSPDHVPFLIHKCVSEIEARAITMKGIYRVNGVKTRVEKLCQAFENGKELVELSQASPHDLSNVLKLYLRQLPEPLMPFRLYNGLMGLAKESLRDGETGKASRLEDKGAETEPEVLAMVERLKELLQDLPYENRATLQYLIKHLCRVSEQEQINKMSPSNLGIVFGPALMRPRPTDATVSLSSLVDYPHQARIVEALIVFFDKIFQESPLAIDKLSRSNDDAFSQGSAPKLQVTAEEEGPEIIAEFQSTAFRASIGSSVDSESESDGGEDIPSTWESTDPQAAFSKQRSETNTDDIPYIGADAQSESEDDNVPSQGNLAENNTNQSNNVLLTTQFLRTPLRCHRPLPVVRMLQRRIALSSSTDRCPQFV